MTDATPKKSRVLRPLLDWAAGFAAYVLGHAAAGSWIGGALAAVAVGCYGLWCWIDGLNSGEP